MAPASAVVSSYKPSIYPQSVDIVEIITNFVPGQADDDMSNGRGFVEHIGRTMMFRSMAGLCGYGPES